MPTTQKCRKLLKYFFTGKSISIEELPLISGQSIILVNSSKIALFTETCIGRAEKQSGLTYISDIRRYGLLYIWSI